MSEWEFIRDDGGRWRWRCVAGQARAESKQAFGRRTDCVADAMRHGYLSWSAERQRASDSPVAAWQRLR